MQRRVSRRLFLADLGKGGVAVLVLGLVACSDTGGGGDVTTGIGSPPPQPRLLQRRLPGNVTPDTNDQRFFRPGVA